MSEALVIEERQCSKCGDPMPPTLKRRYCASCHRDYMRAWRRRKGVSAKDVARALATRWMQWRHAGRNLRMVDDLIDDTIEHLLNSERRGKPRIDDDARPPDAGGGSNPWDERAPG